MSDTIQAVSRALNADVQGISTVSHNVANLGTPGFQSARHLPGFAESLGESNQVLLADGPLKQTQRPLDLALRGRGFFSVQQGESVLLTRSGQFSRDADGWLVNAAGDRVLTDAGALQLPDAAVRVDAQGVIWSGDQRLAALNIVDVAHAARLQAVAGGYRYDGDLVDWRGQLTQGAVEQSNVDAAGETLRLIELSRHAESVQRVISIYDRMLDTGINRLGDN
jgi:flagellar basal body rod protein FlgG